MGSMARKLIEARRGETIVEAPQKWERNGEFLHSSKRWDEQQTLLDEGVVKRRGRKAQTAASCGCACSYGE